MKRKERAEKERVAAQHEFLNRSLRDSKRLQALESGAAPTTGVVNDAFSEDETTPDDVFVDTLHKIISKYLVVVKIGLFYCWAMVINK